FPMPVANLLGEGPDLLPIARHRAMVGFAVEITFDSQAEQAQRFVVLQKRKRIEILLKLQDHFWKCAAAVERGAHPAETSNEGALHIVIRDEEPFGFDELRPGVRPI